MRCVVSGMGLFVRGGARAVRVGGVRRALGRAPRHGGRRTAGQAPAAAAAPAPRPARHR